MSLILSLECSTTICSAALHQDGELLILGELHEKQAHGEKLAPLIKSLTESAGVALASLDAVAVSSGPGSYTGLRIGTSTAKGLCLSLGIPLISVDVLSLMAQRVISFGLHDNALLCPMLDARRMEVYCAIFDSQLQFVSPIEARVIDASSFTEILDSQRVLFFGDGAAKCREVITSSNATFLNEIYPSAAQLGILAYKRFQKRDLEDLVRFEPFYLKEFSVKKSTKLQGVLNK